jgi:membrane protease YdiL (CAAX protease family)
MKTKNNKVFNLALLSTSILMTMLFASHLLRNVDYAPMILGIAIILFEVLVPVEILKYYKINPREFNLYAHNIDTIIDYFLPPFVAKKIHPDYAAIGKELWCFIKISLFILLPYAMFYWAFFQLKAIGRDASLNFSLSLPPSIHYEIITQIFVVALPEELFYRGFLQSSFLKIWPNRIMLYGFPLGRAVLLTNLIFAIGHVVSSMQIIGLLTFFPGLIFSYLTFKNNSLLSAILFHATCNIVSQILYASFFLVRT